MTSLFGEQNLHHSSSISSITRLVAPPSHMSAVSARHLSSTSVIPASNAALHSWTMASEAVAVREEYSSG